MGVWKIGEFNDRGCGRPQTSLRLRVGAKALALPIGWAAADRHSAGRHAYLAALSSGQHDFSGEMPAGDPYGSIKALTLRG